MSFSTSLIKGDVMHLEYYEPYSVYDQGIISIKGVIHDYKDLFNLSGQNRDDACGYHVDCPEGTGYENQINATSFLDTGTHICSGTMLNNDAEDYFPYYWTAWHCIVNVDDDDFENIRFYFDYKKHDCETVGLGSYGTDGQLLAHSNGMDSDYALIWIRDTDGISSEEVCYAGWDASSSTSMIESGVHHPDGQPKKIIFDDDEAYSYPGTINWGDVDGDGTDEISPPNSHWRVRWDDGGTAGGSSGSGVFNDQGLLVGQLSGGNNDCADPTLEEDCADENSENDCYSIVGCEWVGSAANGECVLAAIQDFYGKFSDAFDDDDVRNYLAHNSGITSIGTICGCDGNEDECGVCGGPGPDFLCIDPFGFLHGNFCSEESCNDYLDDQLLNISDIIPKKLFLGQNYPNPFNPTTTIKYDVPTLDNINISLYDLQGRKLKTLINSTHRPGNYEITLRANDLHSGIYIVKIASGDIVQTRKIALIK